MAVLNVVLIVIADVLLWGVLVTAVLAIVGGLPAWVPIALIVPLGVTAAAGVGLVSALDRADPEASGEHLDT